MRWKLSALAFAWVLCSAWQGAIAINDLSNGRQEVVENLGGSDDLSDMGLNEIEALGETKMPRAPPLARPKEPDNELGLSEERDDEENDVTGDKKPALEPTLEELEHGMMLETQPIYTDEELQKLTTVQRIISEPADITDVPIEKLKSNAEQLRNSVQAENKFADRLESGPVKEEYYKRIVQKAGESEKAANKVVAAIRVKPVVKRVEETDPDIKASMEGILQREAADEKTHKIFINVDEQKKLAVREMPAGIEKDARKIALLEQEAAADKKLAARDHPGVTRWAQKDLDEPFPDQELSALASSSNSAKGDIDAETPDSKTKPLFPTADGQVDKTASEYVDGQEIANYQASAAQSAAQIEVLWAMDDTHEHQVPKDVTALWDMPRNIEDNIKAHGDEDMVDAEVKSDSTIPVKGLNHARGSWQKKLSNEIAALRGRSVQKLLATNHVFTMKEEPMAMAADGEDVVQMVVKEQNRELPDEELDDDIKKEVKDVTASIQDTEQKEMTIDDDMAAHAVTGVITAVAQNTEELPNPYHQSCDYNTKNDLFVRSRLMMSNLARKYDNNSLSGCDAVMNLGLCQSAIAVTNVFLGGNDTHPDVLPGYAPQETKYSVMELMAMWCQVSCQLGPCRDLIGERVAAYAADFEKTPEAREIRSDQNIAKEELRSSDLMYQLEKERLQRAALEQEDEQRAEYAKNLLKRRAQKEKDAKINQVEYDRLHKDGTVHAYQRATDLVAKLTTLNFVAETPPIVANPQVGNESPADERSMAAYAATLVKTQPFESDELFAPSRTIKNPLPSAEDFFA